MKSLVAIAVSVAAMTSFGAQAHSTDRYATSSALSTGKWIKIKVSQTGMQYISNTQLSSMGFSDPSKVNVYGFGGRRISERLDETHPDDLPLLPVVRTQGGIIFYGVDHWLWEASSGASNYSHTMQPYEEASYYFLSDNGTKSNVMEEVDLTPTGDLEKADSFIERLVHEKELAAPSVTGRTILGEDLRSPLQLEFALPGNIGEMVSVAMATGTHITGGPGTIRLNSNGNLSMNTLTANAVTNSEQFMRANVFRYNVTGCGENLQLNLTFSSSGVIKLARLDYVEVEYERALQMPADQLTFYYNERHAVEAVMKGITGETQIWDVTVAHDPKRVKFTAVGNEAHFIVEEGYREFVAFNPSKVTRATENQGEVANQDIHSMESPDLLIITPQEYLAQAERVAALHREEDDMTVHVLTPQQIYNEFSSGTADVSAFRKVMKMWYDRDMEGGSQKLKYCLIMSRPTYDNKMVTTTVKNAGYPRVPIWQSASGYTENTSYSTDDFIGMLDDFSSSSSMGTTKIQVAVGRFPVRSLEEATTAVDKLIAYTKDPGKASWRNNVMLIADDGDNGDHLDQTEKMYSSMIASNKGKDYQYERLYLDNFQQQLTSVGYEYPEAKKRMMSKFEEGQSIVTYIGHANTVTWTHEYLLTWKDINSFSNTRLPILYAATCEFARWDADEYSGAEVIWSFPKTGMISVICPSRAVFISMNGPLSMQFGKYALVRNEDGTPTRLGDSFINMKNGISGSDDNKLRYALIGDPAMKMPVLTYNVETTDIYDVDITDPEANLPIIEARSNPKVKGIITDNDGNPVEDFNGFVYLKLYDAEKVIETLGNNGKTQGKVMLYNDRKTKLYDGVAQVENGRWETTIFMPSEIENNYTPGRITYYAISDDGREANGATEQFYVYGYDENAPDDSKGPEILKFVLNHDNFQDGDLTYKTPVVYATFMDESGINLSDAGIGHALMLTLDDRTVYSDVMNFYSPDLYDSRKGSFIYQLPEIPAGKHSLTLSVWDCANNSSYATIHFNVAAVKEPDIYDISIDAGRDGIDFIISSDRPLSQLTCNLDIFDMNGIKVWHNTVNDRTGADSAVRMRWDYTSAAGYRVNKGVYFCRATVTTPEGKTTNKTKKIFVSQ